MASTRFLGTQCLRPVVVLINGSFSARTVSRDNLSVFGSGTDEKMVINMTSLIEKLQTLASLDSTSASLTNQCTCNIRLCILGRGCCKIVRAAARFLAGPKARNIDRRIQRQFFEVWALLGHKVSVVLSISANTPELILSCCPTDKLQIRSELGSKVITCILL